MDPHMDYNPERKSPDCSRVPEVPPKQIMEVRGGEGTWTVSSCKFQIWLQEPRSRCIWFSAVVREILPDLILVRNLDHFCLT